MHRTPVLVLTLLIAGLFSSTPLPAAVVDLEAGPLDPVQLKTVNYRLWMDDGPGRCQGVIVLVPGRHGDGRPLAGQVAWQQLASSLKMALLGCQFTDGEPFTYQNDPEQSVSKSINSALKELAEKSNHPELAAAPLAFWGTSAGSNVSVNYAKAFPDRVIAVASSKGTSGPRGITSDNVEIPMFFALGQQDKPEWIKESLDSIQLGRDKKAPWTLALHPTEGHAVGKSLDVAIPFLRTTIPLRLDPSSANPDGSVKLKKIDPKDGWLADPETREIATYDAFSGKKKTAIWLPDESTAKAWQAYLQ